MAKTTNTVKESEITALEFADLHGFSERDKSVVRMMYKGIMKTENAWGKLLSNDFNYTKK